MRNTSRIEIGIYVFLIYKNKMDARMLYDESKSKKKEKEIFFVIRSKSNLKNFFSIISLN